MFVAGSSQLQKRIINNFNLNESHIDGFNDFMKNILHLRNKISHNYIIYQSQCRYQSSKLNSLYNDIFKDNIEHFKLIHLLKLLEHFTQSNSLVNGSKKYFDSLPIHEKFKLKINIFNDKNNFEYHNFENDKNKKLIKNFTKKF